jgi:hypothetical protein
MYVALYALAASARAASWRRTDQSGLTGGVGHLIAAVVASTSAWVLFEYVSAGADAAFNLYGLNAALTISAAELVIASLLVRRGAKLPELTVLFCFYTVAGLILSGVWVTLAWLSNPSGDRGYVLGLSDDVLKLVAIGLFLLWMLGAVRTILMSIEGAQVRRPMIRAAAMVVSSLILPFALPYSPTFAGSSFQRETANVWEMVAALRQAAASEPTSEFADDQNRWAEIELDQPRRVAEALAGLAPRKLGSPNLFVVGVAGWGAQDVFMRETSGALDVLATRFGADERTIRLVNNSDTVWQDPIANPSNLASVLRGVAARMDHETDVLMLVMTSHGNRVGLALSFGSTVRRILSPQVLKAALDETGIKHRVIIVSACYSGVFVPALADTNTVVITSSSAETNSFGCSSEREWTYFGDAFFNQSLRTESNLSRAFANARSLISAWEERDGVTPSEPQMHIGSGIAAHWPFARGEAMQIGQTATGSAGTIK